MQVYGPEASGKTTLALHAVAEVQKAGGQAVFVDAEHAFNIHFARRLGVNVDVSFPRNHWVWVVAVSQ
jgi:recombination protein RecA